MNLKLSIRRLAILLIPLSQISAQVLTWDGNTDEAWLTAANWSGADAPPDTAAETASFNGSSSNTAVSVGAPTTVGKLQFLSGAASYTISGSPLTLSAASGSTFLENTSGVQQTINSNLVFDISSTGAAIKINVDSTSSLTLSGQLSTSASGVTTGSRSLTFQGGGAISFAPSATFSGVNALEAANSTTLNFYSTGSGAGINNFLSNAGGRINIYANLNSARGLIVSGDGAGIYLSQANVTLSGGNPSFAVNMRGSTAGATVTFGSDFSGTGTVTNSKDIHLNQGSTAAANVTYRFYAAANNTLNLGGVISDDSASGAGTIVLFDGGGVIQLSGASANTTATAFKVQNARLELNKTAGVDAIGAAGVTVGSSGEVRLSQSNQINSGAALTLDGGTLNTQSYSETLGSLVVTAAGGNISLAGDSNLTFASLSSISGTLNITGWESGSTRIFFTDTSAWDSTALSNVIFNGVAGAAISENELVAAVAVPEPHVASLLISGFAAVAVRFFRRQRLVGKKSLPSWILS
ncbi:MAG: cell wall anchor protein [Opitutaceae bacterium]|jgi:hypothetical protein|nr:cell wall anchor protein [Opitutaceae bacterium]